jgi:hypothetical protein
MSASRFTVKCGPHIAAALAAALVAVAALLLFAAPLRAVDAVWTGNAPNDNRWNTAGNWNPNMVPKAAGDKATISIANTTCDLDAPQNLNPVLAQFLLDGADTTNVRFRGVTFTVNGPANLKKGMMSLDNVTWDGTGTLKNEIPSNVGALRILREVRIKSPFEQRGRSRSWASEATPKRPVIMPN